MYANFLKSFFAVALAILCISSTSAATIFESGTLGPTGLLWSDLTDGTVPGTNVNGAVFTGVRFHLEKPALTTEIGGHFVSSQPQKTFFGAIVALDDENDFPDSEDLSTPDVIGTAALTYPTLSDEVFGDINVSLSPGWHALVFGSGLFGTLGSGGAPRNNPDIGAPSYIGRPTTSGWINLAPLQTDFVDHRFVVKGIIVPEPSTVVLGMVLIAAVLLKRKQ